MIVKRPKKYLITAQKNIDVKTMIFIEELNSKDVFCGSIKPIHASLSEPLSEIKSVLVKIHSA